MREVLGAIFSGTKSGMLVVMLGSITMLARVIFGGAGQYDMEYWLWTMWTGAGLLAGLRSGYLAGQQGWLLGTVTGLLLGAIISAIHYTLTGWMGYSWVMLALCAAGGLCGGSAGINLQIHRQRRLGRRRLFYSGY